MLKLSTVNAKHGELRSLLRVSEKWAEQDMSERVAVLRLPVCVYRIRERGRRERDSSLRDDDDASRLSVELCGLWAMV